MRLTQAFTVLLDYRIMSIIREVLRNDRHPRTGAPFKNKNQVIEHLIARGISVPSNAWGAFYNKYLEREEAGKQRRRSIERDEYSDAVELNYMLMECIINLITAIEAGAKDWSSQDILNHMLDLCGYLPRKFSPETFFDAVKQYDSSCDPNLKNAVEWVQSFRHGNMNEHILKRLEEMREAQAATTEPTISPKSK